MEANKLLIRRRTVLDYLAIIFCMICIAFLAVIMFLSLKLHRVKVNAEMNSATEEVDKKFVMEIEDGLKNEEFKMYLQFVVDNKTKKIVSAEALSRWQKEPGQILTPGAYIGVMETSGQIVKLDYYMFEKACGKLAQWKGTDLEKLTLSCNFTRITISEKDFVSKIQKIADKYDFERRKLLLEITEDSIEKNLAVAMNNIIHVKQLGFRIAVDDLGSGFTSLMNLCEYPIHVVKIDRALFLKTRDEKGKKLFRGLVSLAHDLNLTVVCEGVETEEQERFVTETNCDYIQGWYYSRPLPEQEAEAFARAYLEKLS